MFVGVAGDAGGGGTLSMQIISPPADQPTVI